MAQIPDLGFRPCSAMYLPTAALRAASILLSARNWTITCTLVQRPPQPVSSIVRLARTASSRFD
jgi:hypothetical protein